VLIRNARYAIYVIERQKGQANDITDCYDMQQISRRKEQGSDRH
jgi:hypothetical protein